MTVFVVGSVEVVVLFERKKWWLLDRYIYVILTPSMFWPIHR